LGPQILQQPPEGATGAGAGEKGTGVKVGNDTGAAVGVSLTLGRPEMSKMPQHKERTTKAPISIAARGFDLLLGGGLLLAAGGVM